MPHYPYMGIIWESGGGFVQQITTWGLYGRVVGDLYNKSRPRRRGIVAPICSVLEAVAQYITPCDHHEGMPALYCMYVLSKMAGCDREVPIEVGSGDEDTISSEWLDIFV